MISVPSPRILLYNELIPSWAFTGLFTAVVVKNQTSVIFSVHNVVFCIFWRLQMLWHHCLTLRKVAHFSACLSSLFLSFCYSYYLTDFLTHDKFSFLCFFFYTLFTGIMNGVIFLAIDRHFYNNTSYL